ncbi:hypothetical protein ACOMHN_055807 [Nucella lapillus]
MVMKDPSTKRSRFNGNTHFGELVERENPHPKRLMGGNSTKLHIAPPNTHHGRVQRIVFLVARLGIELATTGDEFGALTRWAVQTPHYRYPPKIAGSSLAFDKEQC